jgi:hypothetical protein
MAALAYDVRYAEQRNRLTTAFRLILFIPHYFVVVFWGLFAEILGFVQWFIVLFTGRHNKDIWEMQYAYLGYYSRVMGYVNLLFDPYPEFGTAVGEAPVTTELRFEEPASRLTNGLRFIWIIPAAIIGWALAIALSVVVIIAWFAIVITGREGRGLWDFAHRVVRYLVRLQSYGLLMTDTYPKFDSGDPVAAGTTERWLPSGPTPGGTLPSGSPSSAAGAPLPPPGGPLPPPAT